MSDCKHKWKQLDMRLQNGDFVYECEVCKKTKRDTMGLLCPNPRERALRAMAMKSIKFEEF